MNVIIITGTPGTGKTTIAKKLSKELNYKYIDVSKIIKENKIYDGYDNKRKCFVVDVNKLNKSLIKSINKYKKTLLEKNQSNKNTNIKTRKNRRFFVSQKSLISAKSLKNQKIINDIIKYIKLKKINDKNKTLKIIIKNLKKEHDGLIIDSHLSHYLPGRYVDLCIVAKCELKNLERRLKKKGYHKEKIRENLDVEIFDVCLNEAKEKGHKVLVIGT